VSISAPDDRTGEPLLQVSNLSAFYGELRAIHALNLAIFPGDALALIGANGAGKSTLLRTLVGLPNIGGNTRIEGRIAFSGEPIHQMMPYTIVEKGIALVPEGRRLFGRMTVEDNLLCGAYLPRARSEIKAKVSEVYSLFPRLKERRRQIVSQMSGGEQQMVAIGRALMSSPRLLLLDELSLGLSPAMVEDIYGNLVGVAASGLTLVIVEQDLKRALSASNRFAVMLEGQIVLEGRPGMISEEVITAAYFGSSQSSTAVPFARPPV
jgi:branched-chain amino acid transport system ATP-binding protein